MVDGTKKEYLGTREKSHILAALRYMQKEIDSGRGCPNEQIATNDGEHTQMSSEELDDLCETINCCTCVL